MESKQASKRISRPKLKNVNMRLSEATIKRYKHTAIKRDTTFQALAEAALVAFLPASKTQEEL